ncbi:hypothetical protein KIN20_012002 [Parelaphostrongylus tenuis]|uniref:Uncharacterized protein n=1 Tax=Parelaphostrongylus tenuis TaxID=148309 RepID=A0AAD5QQ79_PARTN|nr:hypothetical protein KIN20_012002 [Parelaphostrongylus tenuis]
MFSASGGREFESDNTVTGGAESNSEFSPLRRNTGLLGMPLTSSTSSVAQPRQSAIQGILNTFLVRGLAMLFYLHISSFL